MAEQLPTKMKTADGQIWRWSAERGGWVPAGEGLSAFAGVVKGASQRLQNIGQGAAELVGAEPDPDARFEAEQLSSQAPISSAIGGFIPDVAAGFGVGGAVTRGATFLQRMATVGKVAAVEGGLGAIAPGTASERLQRGLMSAAAGAGGFQLGNMAQRIAGNIRASREAINPSPLPGQVPGQPPGSAAPQLPPGVNAVPPGLTNEDFLPGSVGAGQAGDIFREPVPGQFDPERGFMGLGDEAIPGVAEDVRRLEAIEEGIEQGVRFEPGVVSGNQATRQALASARSFPVLSDIVQGEISEINTGIYQRQALKALGEKGNRGFTHDTLAGIDQRIDETFQGIYDRNPAMSVDNIINPRRQPTEAPLTITGALDEVVENHIGSIRYEGKRDPTVAKINQAISLISREAGSTKGGVGKVSSQSYGRMRSELRKEHRRQVAAANHNAADTLSEAIDQLDQWFSQGVTQVDNELFHKTLQQYRLLQSIDRPNALSNALQLRPNNIATNLKKNYKIEYARNNRFFRGGESVNTKALDPEVKKFFDLTKVFTAFPEIVGDSGTATREFLQRALGNLPGTATAFAARPVMRTGIRLLQPDLDDVRRSLAEQRGVLDALDDPSIISTQ